MTATVYQAFQTFLTNRFPFIFATVGAIGWLLAMCFVPFGKVSTEYPMMLTNVIGLPVMFSSMLIAQQAKWQFVHPRARLVPGYAKAHVAALLMLLFAATVLAPIFAALRLGISPVGLTGFSALLCGLLVWGMHTQRPLYSLAGLGVFFSISSSRTNGAWLSSSPELAAMSLLACVAGWCGIGLWLRRLVQMTEEDDDYNVPTQTQFGSPSRLEKSEMRRNVVRQLSRSWISGRLTDTWHDRLANLSAPDETSRRRLLRYGFGPTHAWVRGVFFLSLLAVIGVTQHIMFSGSIKNAGETGAAAMTPILFAVMGAAVVHLFLANRRARLSQELLLPLSRRNLVDGLFRAFVRETIWINVPALLLIIAVAPYVAPERARSMQAVWALFGVVAIQPLIVGYSFRVALWKSGLKRMLMLLFVCYSALAVLAAIIGFGQLKMPLIAIVVGVAILIAGVAICRGATAKWRSAELGL